MTHPGFQQKICFHFQYNEVLPLKVNLLNSLKSLQFLEVKLEVITTWVQILHYSLPGARLGQYTLFHLIEMK